MNISLLNGKLRRLVSAFSLLSMLATFVSFSGVAMAFSDTDGHWGEDYIDELATQGVVDSTADLYHPNDSTNRAEMAKFVVLAFDYELDTSYDAGFSDVDSDAWYAVYVNTAAKHGVVGGRTDANGDATGIYDPSGYVNRAEAAKFIKNAAVLSTDTTDAPHFDDVTSSQWFYDYVETLYNNSIVDGTSEDTYSPASYTTRAEIAKMIVNGQNPMPRDEEVVDDGVDGTLSIDIVDVNGGTIPQGATAVAMLGLELTANGDDMTFDGLVVDRGGVGSSTDFSNVYFYNGTQRIGSGHSVSSDSNTVTFSSLGVNVPEGDTVTVWIKADFSSTATASNEHDFSVVSTSSVTVEGGDAEGDFPLEGDTFTIGGADAGTITIEKNSTVSNPTIGQEDAEIANFKLTASNEDMELEQIALTFKGTISAEGGTNFKLMQNGDVLAETDEVDSNDLFTFVLDTPYSIEKGDTRSFTVSAEITGQADSDDTIRVYLDENTDLVAVGQVYGYGAQVSSGSYDNGANDGTDANWSTVQGGQFTIAFNGPAVDDFAPNAKDVAILDLTFTAGRDLEVRKLTFNIDAAAGDGLITSSAANYTDIKLINADTGSTLMGPLELSTSGSDSTQDVAFTDSWYLDAGESVNASLTVDIANVAALDADTIQATLNAVSTTEGVKDTGTGEFLTDIVPSSAIDGYTHNIQTASLAIALASSPVSDTFVKGAEGVTLAGFVLTAGEASDITVTKFLPTVAFSTNSASTAGSWVVSGSSGSADYAKEIVPVLYLYDEDGNQLGTSEAVPNAGKPTFESFELTVPAGSTATVYVKGDIATTAPLDGNSDHVGIDVEATTDVTAEDEDGNSVSFTAADPSGSTDTNATTVDMTIASSGTIAVTAPSSQVEDQLVASGSDDVLIGRFKVKATDEDFEVTKIGIFANDSGTSDSFSDITIKYPTSLSAPTTLDGTSTQTVSTSTGVTFNGLSFMVPSTGSNIDNVVFEVYASAAAHNDDGGGADTADSLQVLVPAYAATFEATGLGSGTTKDGDDSGTVAAALASNEAYVFKSIPTVSVDSDSSNSIVYGTDTEVMRFTVDADANGDLALLALKLDVSSSGISTGTTGLGWAQAISQTRGEATVDGLWKMYEVISGSINYATQIGSGTFVHGWASGQSDLVYMDIYDNIANYTKTTTASFEKISAGASRTYIVTASIKDDGTDNTNSVSVRISNDASANFGNSVQANFGSGIWVDGDVAFSSASFVWSDVPNNSSFGTGSSKAYWHNGYKVSGLPTSYVSYNS